MDEEEIIQMSNKEEQLDEDWKRKRFSTFIIFNLLYFNSGFEQNLTVVTSWSYVSNRFNIENKDFLYAALNTIYFPPVFLAGLVASYGDNTRNIKRLIIMLNICSLVGGLCYMIPSSVFFPLIGQFLSGFLTLQRPLMVGEIARSYRKDQLRKKYAFFTASYGIGYALGPSFAFLLPKADFYIFNLHMTYGNIPGLVRAIQITISLILTIIYVHDLSKQYDYKNDIQVLDDINETEKSTLFLFKVFDKLDIMYILFAAFLVNTVESIADVFYPVYIIDSLHLSKSIVNLCYILPVLIYPLLTILMSRNETNNKVYNVGILGWVLLSLIGLLLLFISPISKVWISITLLFTFSFTTQIFAFIMQVFIAVTLSNLVQSKYQSKLDSLRCICKQCGAIIGSPIGAYGPFEKNYIAFSFVIVSVIMLTISIIRKKKLKDPKIIL